MKWFGLALLYVGLPLLLAEITEVAPWLAERLLRSAARLLPTRHRERYTHEWLGELDAAPGKLFKLLFATRIALRVPATRRELQHREPIWIIAGRWLLASIITVAIAVARLAAHLMGRLSTPSSKPSLDLRLDTEDGFVAVTEVKSTGLDPGVESGVLRPSGLYLLGEAVAPLDTPVEELGLSKRTYHCLKKADLLTIRDIIDLPELQRELLQIRNFGRSSLDELLGRLEELGWFHHGRL